MEAVQYTPVSSYHCRNLASLLSEDQPPDRTSSKVLTELAAVSYIPQSTVNSYRDYNTDYLRPLGRSASYDTTRSQTRSNSLPSCYYSKSPSAKTNTPAFTNNNNYHTMDVDNITGPDRNLIDANFEPQVRERCNTWPLRPIASPSVHDSESNPAPVIQEEPEDYQGSTHNLSGGSGQLLSANAASLTGLNNSAELGSQNDLNNKKQSSRKNAWGNMSYAELITRAIGSSPDKRLTLSQIYDWMVQNVSYFRDKGDSNSSAGWKNSIRHNLSLHNRFMRIQNEGAGKSSWWVINPDAKPGKAPRRPRDRGHSMDSKSSSMKAKRDRAMRKVEELKKKGLVGDRTRSPVSPNDFTLSPGDGEHRYRDRASSFLSDYSGRRSPLHDDILNEKLSPYGSDTHLDFIPNCNMDTGNLPDDLDQMMKVTELPDNTSFITELDSIGEPGSELLSGLQGQTMYNNRPYRTYQELTGYPPPPYPNNDPNYNKSAQTSQVVFGNDPMMSPYNQNNSQNVSPNLPHRQFNPVYTNGMTGNQPAIRISQTQQNRGLQSTTTVSRNQVSPALRESAPILTSQLMGYQTPRQRPALPQRVNINSAQSAQSSQTAHNSQTYNNNNGSSNPNQSTLNTPTPQINFEPNFLSQTGNSLSELDFPNDIDFPIEDMLSDQLNCDVNQVIQQELKMDGGHLDFTGFDGYSQTPPNSSNTKSGSNGIIS